MRFALSASSTCSIPCEQRRSCLASWRSPSRTPCEIVRHQGGNRQSPLRRPCAGSPQDLAIMTYHPNTDGTTTLSVTSLASPAEPAGWARGARPGTAVPGTKPPEPVEPEGANRCDRARMVSHVAQLPWSPPVTDACPWIRRLAAAPVPVLQRGGTKNVGSATGRTASRRDIPALHRIQDLASVPAAPHSQSLPLCR